MEDVQVQEQAQQNNDPFERWLQSDIKIFVVNPVVKDEGLTTNTFYTVQGTDKNGNFSTTRKFSDFDKIRNIMRQRFCCWYLPPLPSKKFMQSAEQSVKQVLIGGQQNSVTQERLRHLNFFVRKMATNFVLYYSEEFQAFLRWDMQEYQKNVEKKFPEPAAAQILDLFAKHSTVDLQVLREKGVSSPLFLALKEFFKSKRDLIEKQRDCAKELMDAHYNYMQKLNQFTSVMMPSYENNYQNEQLQEIGLKPIFGQQSQLQSLPPLKFYLNQISYTDYLLPYDFLCYEFRDFRTMVEIFESFEQWDKRVKEIQKSITKKEEELKDLNAGKTSFKSVFSSKSSDEQKIKLQDDIQQLNLHLQQVEQLIPILIGHILTVELKNFILSKQDYYSTVMKKFAFFQNQACNTFSSFWKEIQNM